MPVLKLNGLLTSKTP